VTVRSGYQHGDPYLEVEDDGPGIPESERSRVRERFYRIPGSPAGGCGLGLAIVEEIARQHGARLSIETATNGQGAHVRVLFPPKHA
jgi:two-component system sensor histidine kinase TctE